MIKINEEVILSGGDSGIVIKGTEHCIAEVLEPLLAKFKELGFNYLRSHCKDKAMDSNSVNFYCSDILSTLTRKKGNKKNIVLDMDIVDPTILDGSLDYYAESMGNSSKENDHLNLLYKYNGYKYVIGYYDVKSNNLYLSDITHNGGDRDDTIEFIRVMLTTIIVAIEEFNAQHSIERTFVPFGALSAEQELMIGLDPEFLLTREDGTKMDCSEIVPASASNPVGTDGEAPGYRDVGEFRPKEGSPKVLKDNMKGLLTQLGIMIRDNGTNTEKVYAGGGKSLSKAIGGHIHFNIPSSKELVRLLDDFIGKPLLAMKGSERSSGNSYGKLSAIEPKPYGFEYRTPPSFIGKPDLFEGVVAIAYCLAKTWAAISTGDLEFSYMTNSDTGAYVTSYKDLVHYEDYKTEIDTLVAYIVDGKSIEEFDVLAAWEITSEDMVNVSL